MFEVFFRVHRIDLIKNTASSELLISKIILINKSFLQYVIAFKVLVKFKSLIIHEDSNMLNCVEIAHNYILYIDRIIKSGSCNKYKIYINNLTCFDQVRLS